MLTTSTLNLDYANKLIFVRDYDGAKRILDQLALKTPDDLILQLRRIELAAKLKQLAVLNEEFNKRNDGEGSSLSKTLCQIVIGLHGDSLDPDEAIVRLQDCLRNHGEQAMTYYGIGYSLEMRGNVDRAIFNYEKSVAVDSRWYPAYFGLSQLHYQKGDSKLGDQFFLMFEKAAPYNVYGNFETHRSLSSEFLQLDKFNEAEIAITTLAEWWIENKGRCPLEIQLFELLSVSRIAELAGDKRKASSKHSAALAAADNILSNPASNEGVLYFSARCLEDFGEFKLALQLYKKTLRLAGDNPAIVQKVGGQFLSAGEFQLALELFQDSYQAFPDNPEIRFCLLVSKMKLAEVNVEDYLIGKERLKQLATNSSDKVELLALLHSLQAKFPDDPDVHHQMGDIYLRMGNVERAGRHFRRMRELDPLSRQATLRFVGFVMNYGNPDEAQPLLAAIAKNKTLSTTERNEISWLTANYYYRKNEYAESQLQVMRALEGDPWNVSYLVLAIINLKNISITDVDLRRDEQVLSKLSRLEEDALNWAAFDEVTVAISGEGSPELIYMRAKLRFLYAELAEASLDQLIKAATEYDPKIGNRDLLKLLNTNFDSPFVYYSLGLINKETWQLEVASMWFEQVLALGNAPEALRAQAYAELGDALVWRDQQLPRALEFAKLAVELGGKDQLKAVNAQTHAYLKMGQLKSAIASSQSVAGSADFETRYLQGLIEYRNGSRDLANQIWKPLLTTNANSVKIHNIKQEILKYYFEGAPYFRAN